MAPHYFTVFTPTYNRGYIIGRVYDSLLAQTVRNFEWIVVDDGSTDDTRDLVENWQRQAPFRIRYIYQENAGKHFAANVGVREAEGDLFLFLDSDDACVPETLEQFGLLWDGIPEESNGLFSTVGVLCVDQFGEVVGGRYSSEMLDVEDAWHQYRIRKSGERWGINRTDVLRSFPFPQFEGEKFIPEGIVWNRMARKYRTRFVNKPLRIYERQRDSITVSMKRTLARNPNGSILFYNELFLLPLPILEKCWSAANYVRYSFHGKVPPGLIVRNAVSPLWATSFFGVGYLMYRLDGIRS